MAEVFTLRDLEQWDRVGAGLSPVARLAVCGDPVAHSVSPAMHNAALAACGIEMQYVRLHLRAEELAHAFTILRETGAFLGVNCTIPHKVEALQLVDEVSSQAALLGAVNTVRCQGNRLHGFNTDGPGLQRAVQEQFGMALKGQRILVLGAGGGAGRAVAMFCALEGCRHLTLVNRTHEKTHALAKEIHGLGKGACECTAVEWTEAALADALRETDLLINCTAAGMKAGEASPLPARLLHDRLSVYDTIYTAHQTPLMVEAVAAGARAANGLSMLLHQGAIAFEIWFERPAPVEVMREALVKLGR